jgi:hypothetical protein
MARKPRKIDSAGCFSNATLDVVGRENAHDSELLDSVIGEA